MYKCNICEHNSAIKLGKCPSCGEFGTMIEDLERQPVDKKSKSNNGKKLNETQQKEISFFQMKNQELGRVFQQGIKSGGLYLIGGEPGIGKSTIILQIIKDLIDNNKNIKIGYFSGEESPDQIYNRIDRIDKNIKTNENLDIFHTTKIEDITTTSEYNNYDMIILDSIQTVYSENSNSPAGSPNQVKQGSENISEFCKKNNITGFIIGHVTKGGEIAGPKYLEHIVDVVSYLEGDRFGQYRFLRSKKNRFGSTDDIGIFEMGLFGLTPVYNLKDRIIENSNTSVPGSVLTVGIDNGRPVIVNVEVLLNKTKYKYPSRTAVGIDNNRLNLITAIIERYLNINLGYFDIFVNIPGEFKFYDSGLDLAIAASILGQYKNKIIDKDKVFIGELGLGGQVLSSKLHQKRVKEIENDFNIIDINSIKNIVELKNMI